MASQVRLTRPERPARTRDYSKPVHKQDEAAEVAPPLPPSKEGEGRRGLVAAGGEGEEEKLERALALADELKSASRKKLIDHLAFLELQGGAASTRDQDMWAVAIYEAIVAELGTGGAGMPGPMAAKRLLAARASWAPVESFAQRIGIADMKVARRQAAYRLLAALLVERCQGSARAVRAPLTIKMLANSTGEIAAVFDAAFPGYAGNGLASMLFTITRPLSSLRSDDDEA